jgi:hypothetical protein
VGSVEDPSISLGDTGTGADSLRERQSRLTNTPLYHQICWLIQSHAQKIRETSYDG